MAFHSSRASADGSAPRTSASPPVFAKGCASEPMSRTDPGAFGAAARVGGNYATRADSDMRRGACSSGIGLAAKSF